MNLKSLKRRTNLNPPHQIGDEDSVDDALDDENTVGEFGGLCDLQIFLCRESKQPFNQTLEEVSCIVRSEVYKFGYLPLVKTSVGVATKKKNYGKVIIDMYFQQQKHQS